MKTTVEINGICITVEETDGILKVAAECGGEAIEDFEINCADYNKPADEISTDDEPATEDTVEENKTFSFNEFITKDEVKEDVVAVDENKTIAFDEFIAKK